MTKYMVLYTRKEDKDRQEGSRSAACILTI